MHFRSVLIPLVASVLVASTCAPRSPGSSGLSAAASAACPAPRKLAPGEAWVDPSPHRCGYVTVDGVQLHYLSWGGQGEPIVLLHGLGTTAHTFDDLAPRLTDRFGVFALTRRGHAESDHPEGGYTIAQTTADVLGFLDAVGIRKAHFVAHSFGGAEATRLATEHPDRVRSVVYLDALPEWAQVDSVFGLRPAPRPAPGDAFRTVGTHRDWLRRAFYGFWTPALEADFRYARPNPAANAALQSEEASFRPNYARIRVPALAVVATQSLRTQFPWLTEASADPSLRNRAREYLDRVLNPYLLVRADRFRAEVPNGRVVVLEGSHYIMNSDPEKVAQTVRTFLLDLK